MEVNYQISIRIKTQFYIDMQCNHGIPQYMIIHIPFTMGGLTWSLELGHDLQVQISIGPVVKPCGLR